MAGVIGISPVIIKHKLVHVIPIRKLFACPNLKDIKIWTDKGWMPIIGMNGKKPVKKFTEFQIVTTGYMLLKIANCF